MLKRKEMRATYLTHVCRLQWGIESVQKIDENQKLSASTVEIITCINILTIMLAGAGRRYEEKGNGGGESRV